MEWNTLSADIAPSVFSATKNPTGAWKSRKQGGFMKLSRSDDGLESIISMLPHRVAGALLAESLAFLNANPEAFMIQLDGMVQWAEGRRGRRQVSWLFLCDAYGVALGYKLAFGYNSDASSSWGVPEKATEAFKREENAEFAAWKAQVDQEILEARAAKEAKDKRRQEEKDAYRFIGEPKRRMEMELTLLSESLSEGYYGLTFIYRFVDAQGNPLIWFASTCYGQEQLKELQAGPRKYKFTVKEHQDHETFGRSTVINRVVLVA